MKGSTMGLKEGTYWKGRLKVYRNKSSWGVVLHSAGEDYRHDKKNRLVVEGFGWSFWLSLPDWVKPVKITKSYEGKSYVVTEKRVYGISLFDGEHLTVSYGHNDINVENPQRWSCFLPWTQFAHVRHSGYDLNHKHVLDFDKSDYDQLYVQRALVPSAEIGFLDYDGQALTATVRIEEREWRRGDKWGWRWLRWFSKPIISRRLEVEYSGETGPRKGEWKGGTIAESINMLPNEPYMQAFARLRQQRLEVINKQRRRD